MYKGIKNILSKTAIVLICGATIASPGGTIQVNAKEVNTKQTISKTTDEQKKVTNDFKNIIKTHESNNSSNLSRAAAKTYSKAVTFKRGTALAWSKDNVNFSYNGTKVISSSGWQETGWIFPNIVRANGISRYSTTTYEHKYRATKTIGAGTVTPWGDVKLYETNVTDYCSVRGSGRTDWWE